MDNNLEPIIEIELEPLAVELDAASEGQVSNEKKQIKVIDQQVDAIQVPAIRLEDGDLEEDASDDDSIQAVRAISNAGSSHGSDHSDNIYPAVEFTDVNRHNISPTDREAIDILSMVMGNAHHHPMNAWGIYQKWAIASFYCLLQTYVTLSTTSYLSAMGTIQGQFGGSHQLITLGQSLFLAGNACGPAFLGPLSDVVGRKWVYCVSIALYAALNLGCAYAVNLPMLIIFMFLCGVAGSSAATNVAGSIADMFGDIDGAGQAMALFVISANAGPSMGAPLGNWISNNPKMGLKWIFLVNSIIGAGFTVACAFIPETLPRIMIAIGANGELNEGGVDDYEARVLNTKILFAPEMKFMIKTTFELLVTEPIIWVLAFYNGCTYGLLFLYLAGIHQVFVINNHLSTITADLTYLCFMVGVILMFAYIPVQTWFYGRDRQENGRSRPEARFFSALIFVWLFPISLLWFAFTCEGNVSFWSPLVAGTCLAFVDPLLWLAMLNYITDSYPHVTASAIAAFFVPSFIIAGGFAHLGVLMFEEMEAKIAMLTIGCLSFSLVILVNLVYYRGKYYRSLSSVARHS